MKKTAGILSLVLIMAVLGTLTGCGAITVDDVMQVIAPEATVMPGSDVVFETAAPEAGICILPMTYEKLDGRFCPFFAESDGDVRVAELTQLSVSAESDGKKAVNISSVEAQDGSTVVAFELDKKLCCSDGRPLTADDLLFTLYVLLDGSYDGPQQLRTLPIRGLSDYWNGISADIYTKYMLLYGEIYNNGDYDEVLKKALEEAKKAALDAGWKEDSLQYEPGVKSAQADLDAYDTEKAEEIRTAITEAWQADAAAMVRYTVENYSASIELRTDLKQEEVLQNEGLQVAYTMIDRGVASMRGDGSLYASATDSEWDLKTAFPTVDDLYNVFYSVYNGDVGQYFLIEGYGREDLLSSVQNALVRSWAQKDENYRGEVKSISGVVKINDTTVKVTLEYCDEEVINTLRNFYVVPLHVYGDESNFMPGKDLYGFPCGDISSVRAKAGETTGAGEYALAFKDGLRLCFAPNEYYWAGETEADGVVLEKG